MVALIMTAGWVRVGELVIALAVAVACARVVLGKVGWYWSVSQGSSPALRDGSFPASLGCARGVFPLEEGDGGSSAAFWAKSVVVCSCNG